MGARHSGLMDIVMYLSPHQLTQVRALAKDIVLCSWARHFTHTVSLSTQKVINQPDGLNSVIAQGLKENT